jgi:RimJ/RimL family protein N-acetyltransferase
MEVDMDDADPASAPVVTFRRLTEVPVAAVRALLNEPRNRRHLPLAGDFSPAQAAEWVRDKDAHWERHGFGPEAVFIDGEFAGWGGFQREPSGVDFGLVLLPAHWGQGAAILSAALDRAFGEMGLDEVVVALPFSRDAGAVLRRLGFHPDGEVAHGTVTFRQYRLVRSDWRGPGRRG